MLFPLTIILQGLRWKSEDNPGHLKVTSAIIIANLSSVKNMSLLVLHY
jgi:hypothetical protein